MEFDNLYINGDSFTRGHNLPNEYSWPYLLHQELKSQYKNINLINNSANAQSLGSILTKTHWDIQNEQIKDSLFVIGLTWPTRYSVLMEDYLFTIGTPNYISKIFNSHPLNRRILLDSSQKKLNVNSEKVDQYIEITKKYCEYINSKIKYDSNFEKNQLLESKMNLNLMESYFILKNIKYIFVEFQNSLKLNKSINLGENYYSFQPINSENYVHFCIENKDLDQAHPSKDHCVHIKDQLLKKINYLYPSTLKNK